MRNKFEKFLVFSILTSIIVLVISCIKYSIFGSSNWDEPLDLLGIDLHLDFARDVLKGKRVNYQDMQTNFEWYGIGLKLIYAFPMLILKRILNAENQFLNFATLRGFSLLIYIASGVVFYQTSKYYQKSKSKILALIYFTFPLLAGESFVNIKDIPFAICFSFYSLFNGLLVLNVQKRIKISKQTKYIKNSITSNNEKIIYFLSIFMAALLINNKATLVAPIFLIESILTILILNKKEELIRSIFTFCKKFAFRIISVLGITYLISPAAWLEPIKYYGEVIPAFTKFYGNSTANIGGVILVTNTDTWNLFEYLWRWFLIKIPIIMIILIFIFFISIFLKLNRKYNLKTLISNNPLFLFYGLQLLLVPSLAILANSSSYNSLRHWCFMYPPLVIFSAYVVDNYLINSNSKIFNNISKFFVVIFSALGIIDNVLMMPYSNLSFNFFGRKIAKFENTDIDYWGHTSGELLKGKFLKGYEVKSDSAPFKTGTAHSPYHTNKNDHKYPFAYGSSKPSVLINHSERYKCKKIKTVERSLLFRKEPLLFSKIGICPLFAGNYWNIWSDPNGAVEIENISSNNYFKMPLLFNSLDIKRIKEDNLEKGTISILFLKNGTFTIEKLFLDENVIKYSTFEVPNNLNIQTFLSDFVNPAGFVASKESFISEWILGFDNPGLKTKTFYEDNKIDLVSIDQHNIGLICKKKNERDFRVVLKDKSGEWIYKPNGKSGDFIIKKVECISDQNGNIQKIFLYDSNGQTTYKWEIDLNGTVIESKQVKTTTSKIQRNYKSEWEMGIDNAEIKPEPFFKNEKIELVSIDKNYVGIICKIKNKKDFRILLKDKSGNLIFKPNGKSGDFSIKKGDCVFNESSKLESVFLYDSNGDVTYRWEIDLNGIVLKSELIKS